MPTARRDENGLLYHLETEDVALLSGANTATAVVFDVAYPTTPVMRVVSIMGTGGTADGVGGYPNFDVKSVTKTGFTWDISGTGLGNNTVRVKWFAHQES